MPDRTTKQRNEVRFVLVDVCWWIACNDPTSCRCSNDVRANVDGVYRIREEVTDEDCGLNSSWSIVGSSPLYFSLLKSLHPTFADMYATLVLFYNTVLTVHLPIYMLFLANYIQRKMPHLAYDTNLTDSIHIR